MAKVDLRAMLEVRGMQENPELGEFRAQAALERMGIHLSRRTVGRILAANREAEGLKKPSRGRKEKREMPFEASFRHQYWTSDVRYLEHSIPGRGQAYVGESYGSCHKPQSGSGVVKLNFFDPMPPILRSTSRSASP